LVPALYAAAVVSFLKSAYISSAAASTEGMKVSKGRKA
jgi:hypothetical protein